MDDKIEISRLKEALFLAEGHTTHLRAQEEALKDHYQYQLTLETAEFGAGIKRLKVSHAKETEIDKREIRQLTFQLEEQSRIRHTPTGKLSFSEIAADVEKNSQTYFRDLWVRSEFLWGRINRPTIEQCDSADHDERLMIQLDWYHLQTIIANLAPDPGDHIL